MRPRLPQHPPPPPRASCAGRSDKSFGILQKTADLLGQPGTAMPMIDCGLRLTAVAAALLLSSAASAQLFQQQPQQRPAAPWPAATAPGLAAPGTTAPRPTAPSPRGAACHGGASFDRFLADLKQRAVSEGVSQRTLAAAATYLVYDQGIVNRDRGQRVFGQIFTQFAGRMAAPYRMQQGHQRIQTHAAAFSRAEKEYGVPPAVIAAFWGLESDFGANMGNLSTLPSLVSLAYDCRRSEMFQ